MGRFPLTPFNRIFQPSRHSKSGGFHSVSLHKNRSQTNKKVSMASYHFSVKSKNKGYAIQHYLYIARLMQYENVRKKVMKF
jgi:hypothetical protein